MPVVQRLSRLTRAWLDGDDAVLRNLAVIGGAVRALSDGFKAAHGEVTWPAIAGLRNVVVHEHFRVNPDLIRDILDSHLSVLATAIGSGK